MGDLIRDPFEILGDPFEILGIGGDPFTGQMPSGATHAIGKPNQDIMSEATRAQTESAISMGNIADELWGTGANLRPSLQTSYENVLSGGITGQESPLYQALKGGVGTQYDIAGRNLAESGGGSASKLISEGKARGLGDLMSTAAVDDYSKLFGLAFGQPGTALQGHYGAGSIWGNVGNQMNQQQANFNQNMSGIGQGLGMMFSGG